MSLTSRPLPEGVCYPATVQELLDLFAQHLLAPTSGKVIYVQTPSPTNVPEGTGWFEPETGVFRIYALVEGAPAPSWQTVAIAEDSVDTVHLKNKSVTLDKLSDSVQTAFNSVTATNDRIVSRLEENIGGGSHQANFYIMANGHVRCTGFAKNGKLGIGQGELASGVPIVDNTALPKRCCFNPPLNGAQVVKVYTQLESTFALTNEGGVYVCGSNYGGQLGLRDNVHRWVFTQIPKSNFENRKVVEMAVGSGGGPYLSCYARTEDGYVYSWGYNTAGQLGHGTQDPYDFPISISTINSGPVRVAQVISIGGGTASTNVRVSAYLLMADGSVYACGYNAYGQLGLNDLQNRSLFQKIQFPPLPEGVTVTKVVATGDGSMGSVYFILSDGRVYAAGYNKYGQLGRDSTAEKHSDLALVVRADLSPLGSDGPKVVDLAAFDGNTTAVFALMDDKTAYVWGYNGDGVLGIGTTVNQTRAQAFSLTGVEKVRLGGNLTNLSAAVLLSDGSVQTAGYNSKGQLGRGDTSSTYKTFGRVMIDHTNVLDISFGANNNPATASATVLKILLNSGQVLVCGYDAAKIGQLGVDSTPASLSVPQFINF